MTSYYRIADVACAKLVTEDTFKAVVEHTLLLTAQVIPHNFGRQRPAIIHSQRMVEDKIRMCDVLSDIEVAQDLLEAKDETEGKVKVELQPHPADEKYASLKADLEVIRPAEEEYRIVEKYCQVGDSSSTGSTRLAVMQYTHHSPRLKVHNKRMETEQTQRSRATLQMYIPDLLRQPPKWYLLQVQAPSHWLMKQQQTPMTELSCLD